jgi:ABC-type uncharacterized transport system involved in gliding motility auxiliary subunit
MQRERARYARYLALAGLAAVAIALAAWLILSKLALWSEILGAVGLVLLASAVLLNPAGVKAALGRRQARYGGNAFLMSLAFVGIVGVLNYLGARHYVRWDVTAEKQFSLSEQTLQLLRSLQEPVQVKLFFTPNHYNRQQAEDLIKEYAARSAKLTYEFIDPDTQRRLALDYGIGRDGTIVFERNGRREFCFGVQEQDLTSALLKVTQDRTRTVYFLTGHQERDPENTDAQGYSQIKQALTAENYQVKTLNLAMTTTLPSDIDVLVIAGPKGTLAEEELNRLANYVEQGGKVLALVEPGMPDPFAGLLRRYGLELPDDLVLDPVRSFFGDIATPLVDRYTFHQITKDLTGLTTLFPMARSISITQPLPEGWNVQFLAQSSSDSWAETGYREKQVRPDAHEARGPLGLAAVAEPSQTGTGKGRLVVIGSANFCSNDLLTQVRGSVGNLDLFMNAINWLAEEEALISIRPKEMTTRQVTLTAAQARTIIYTNILFVPLVVLAVGVWVWWRRR